MSGTSHGRRMSISVEPRRRRSATAARKAGRQAQVLAVTGAAPDHPVGLDALEGAYLKAVWLRLGERTGPPPGSGLDDFDGEDGPDESDEEDPPE